MSKIKLEELILVGSELKNPRIIKYIQQKNSDNMQDYLVISIDTQSDRKLSKSNIPHKVGESFLEESQYSMEKEMDYWFSDWLSRKRVENNSIINNFKHRNVSWWWLIDRRIRSETLKVCTLIRTLQHIKKQIQPEKIILYDEENRLQHLVPQIFRSQDLNTIKSRIGYRIYSFFSSNLRQVFGIQILHLREWWYKFLGNYVFKKYTWKKPKSTSCIAVLTKSTAWRMCFNRKRNQFQLGDFHFQNIQDELTQSVVTLPIVELFNISNFKKDKKVIKEKKKVSKNLKIVFLNGQMNSEGKKQLHKEIRIFKKQFQSFTQKLLHDEDLTFSQVNFSKIMKKRILWFIKAYIPLGLRWKFLFSVFISKYSIKAILYNNEFFTFGRSITLSTMENSNVISFAVQHGFFTKYDVGLSRLQSENKGIIGVFSPPHPRITAVYGSYYKNVLLEAGYPEENILISGNPVYDYIDELKRNISREDIIKRLNLASDKQIIVIGTQPIFFEKLISPISTIIELGKKNPHFQLILKVHPRDDISRYNSFKKEATIPLRIVKDINIFLILSVCDVYLTYASTTILDALILKKKVCVVNYEGKSQLPRFMQTKAIFELKSPQETEELIPKLLRDNDYQQQKIPFREKYLSEQIFHLDGNATKRIVSKLFELLNNQGVEIKQVKSGEEDKID